MKFPKLPKVDSELLIGSLAYDAAGILSCFVFIVLCYNHVLPGALMFAAIITVLALGQHVWREQHIRDQKRK